MVGSICGPFGLKKKIVAKWMVSDLIAKLRSSRKNKIHKKLMLKYIFSTQKKLKCHSN